MRFLVSSVVLILAIIVLSQSGPLEHIQGSARHNKPPSIVPTPTPTLSGFGALISGVTAPEKNAWGQGRIIFQETETPIDGLGPIFNNTSCFNCHNQPDFNNKPIVGGASAQTEIRFRTTSNVFDLIHVSSINPVVCQDVVPFDANLVAHRKSLQTFGLGLIEAIPDATIINNQSRNNKHDGVSGHAAVLTDSVNGIIASGIFKNGIPNRIGRFGWKCQNASLLAFAADAKINELGETNRFFGIDFSPHQGGLEPPNNTARDAAEPPGITATTPQDPPINSALPENPDFNSVGFNPDEIDEYTVFMQLNAPPPIVPLSSSALRGQTTFTKINCTACHLPQMKTGASPISATLSFQNVNLYSDLLLHDMGSLGDGIVQAAAGANEMRTAPLWGVRARAPYLHDGRASTLIEAILAHDGEALIIRNRFAKLPTREQQDVIDFLNSI